LGGEHLVELNYKSNLTPWLLVQPVVQWFVQPGRNPTRQTVVVAGFSHEDHLPSLIQLAKRDPASRFAGKVAVVMPPICS
jgi:hypothetical protein